MKKILMTALICLASATSFADVSCVGTVKENGIVADSKKIAINENTEKTLELGSVSVNIQVIRYENQIQVLSAIINTPSGMMTYGPRTISEKGTRLQYVVDLGRSSNLILSCVSTL